MLQLDNINVFYGEIQALYGVSIHVEQGETVALLGSNGAGKSTTLKTISGLLHPRAGSVKFQGKPIGKMSAEEIARLGVIHVPEGRQVFPGLTVYENLILGASARGGKKPKDIDTDIEYVLSLFPDLKTKLKNLSWTLSGGQQQMVAIGRGLMGHPKLLMLDEPSLGLAPIVVSQIFKVLEEVSKSGTTILLVEQNANLALSISNRGYVLETGKVVLEDSGASLLQRPEVQHAYLGVDS